MSLSKRLSAEFIGSAFLLAMVVGSGIMAERLAGANVALALLANAVATGAGLIALILLFGEISGAHFNPLVTLSLALQKKIAKSELLPYILAQLLGACTGVFLAHLMFELPLVTLSQHTRSGLAQSFSEVLASFGLIAVIMGCSRHRPNATPFAVAAYIVSAYWFTASTSFANPAVTLARALTDSFAGIRPADVMHFIAAQICGAIMATAVFSWLLKPAPDQSLKTGQ